MCMCLTKGQTHKKASKKCVRSPSIVVTCVQYMRILMDHKGVCVQALSGGGFSAGKHFSVGFCHFFLDL